MVDIDKISQDSFYYFKKMCPEFEVQKDGDTFTHTWQPLPIINEYTQRMIDKIKEKVPTWPFCPNCGETLSSQVNFESDDFKSATYMLGACCLHCNNSGRRK